MKLPPRSESVAKELVDTLQQHSDRLTQFLAATCLAMNLEPTDYTFDVKTLELVPRTAPEAAQNDKPSP